MENRRNKFTLETKTENLKSVFTQCCRLTAVVVLCWAVMAVPAYQKAGIKGIEGLSYASLLTLVPGWLVFFIGSSYRVPSTQAMMVLLSSGARFLSVGFGALAVRYGRPDMRLWDFYVWLIALYLITLFVETRMQLREMST
jgi:hypothetical protein